MLVYTYQPTNIHMEGKPKTTVRNITVALLCHATTPLQGCDASCNAAQQAQVLLCISHGVRALAF
jgi:hypothetical protein